MQTSLSVDQVCELVKRQAPMVLLDVREADEYAVVAIEGSVLIPLQQLEADIPKLDLPKDKQVICVCRSGRRSSMAAELLRSKGYQAVNMEGGMRDWIKHRYAEGLISEDDFVTMSTFLGPYPQ
ncbi:rhodanese-like domain-containing protein [Candidatus Woesearchaeota archaeon]|nr:rhodanese-like domain-containing protein [Candidatus Woesearchaeota archaeon]